MIAGGTAIAAACHPGLSIVCLGLSSPVTAGLLWALYWCLRTGPVLVDDVGVQVPKRNYAVRWEELSAVEARPPIKLRVFSAGGHIDVFVGGELHQARASLLNEKERARLAPASDRYRE